jgi:hypothetical protein
MKMEHSKSECLSPSGKGRLRGESGKREALVRTRKKVNEWGLTLKRQQRDALDRTQK